VNGVMSCGAGVYSYYTEYTRLRHACVQDQYLNHYSMLYCCLFTRAIMAESLSWRRNCAKSDSNCATDFSRSSTRLQHLVYRETEEFRCELSAILDELTAFDYPSNVQSEEVSN